MRVIAGRLKGRRLKSPKRRRGGEVTLRPLTGRVKEALFNILQNEIEDSRFLDLFAGTGAVGIEALSRGAARAFFVEKDHHAVTAIRENLKATSFEDRAEVFCLDARRALSLLGSRGTPFQIIFIGAPYDSPVLDETLEALGKLSIADPAGCVIAEHRKNHTLASDYGSLAWKEDRRYGETVLSFYTVRGGTSS